MHCEKNFPFRKQKSDLDIGLEDGISDKEYLTTLKVSYEVANWKMKKPRRPLIEFDKFCGFGHLVLTRQWLVCNDSYTYY